MTPRTYVAPVSFGIGDLVVSLPAVQAVIAEGTRTGAETWLVARSPAQALLAERIDGLTGCVPEEGFDPDEPAAHCGRLVDLRDHPLQRDHWWGSAEFVQAYGRIGINDILSRICADLGIDADFTRPVALRAFPRPDVRDTVLLLTETDGPSKRWPAPRWEALAAKIRASGATVRRVVRSAESVRAATATATAQGRSSTRSRRRHRVTRSTSSPAAGPWSASTRGSPTSPPSRERPRSP